MVISRYLRKGTQKNGTCLIEMRLTWKQRKVRWSSGMRINNKLWDSTKQKAKSFDAGSMTINDELDRQEKIALGILQDFFAQNVLPTEEEVKHAIDIALGKKVVPVVEVKVKEVEGIFQYWKGWIERNRRTFSYSYMTSHTAALSQFVDCWGDMKWEELTQQNLEAFVVAMIEGELTNNSIKVYLSRFQKVINEVRALGVSVPCNMHKIHLKGSESIPVWHTMIEVRQLYHHQYRNSNQRIVADAYVLAIASGLRFSDLIRLSNAEVVIDKIRDEGNIRVIQTKTGEVMTMAMTDLAMEIWAKYDGNPLDAYVQKQVIYQSRKVSYSMYNIMLEQIGEAAGITQEILKRYKIGNEWREIRGPKWKFMTSHVARHTFGMIGVELGVPIEVLQKAFGHKTITSTERYARMQEANAGEVLRNKFKINM